MTDSEKAWYEQGWQNGYAFGYKEGQAGKAADPTPEWTKPKIECACENWCGDVAEENDHPKACCKGLTSRANA